MTDTEASRRQFLLRSAALAGTLASAASPLRVAAAPQLPASIAPAPPTTAPAQAMTNREVMEAIHRFHGPIAQPRRETWPWPEFPFPLADTMKWGDPDATCRGIAVCDQPGVDVIHKAAALGCNFLLTHEATFFNNADRTDWLAGDRVYAAKATLLNKYGICVVRDHDGIHLPGSTSWAVGHKAIYGIEPDATGMYHFDGIPVADLARWLIEKHGSNGARIVGDPYANVYRYGAMAHYYGMARDQQMLVQLGRTAPDALTPGEVTDFTFHAYVWDRCQLGKPISAIELGHFKVEEPMMAGAVGWLREITHNAIPVHFVQMDDIWSYIV